MSNISWPAAPESRARVGLQARSLGLALALSGLVLGTLLARLPFQVDILTNFDAVNYALALEHFDMRLSQPQAPGYPLYVLLGRLFWGLGGIFGAVTAGQALVWLSMVSSAFGAAAVFLGGQSLFNRRVGWTAALLLASSSVYWYVSQIASPYTLDLFFSALVGWLCWRLLESDPRSGWREPTLWLAAVSLGLAGAFRLQTLVFLLPLFVYAVRLRPFRQILAGLAVAGSIFALFFVPAVWVSGGPRTFSRLMLGVVPLVRDFDTLARTTRVDRFVTNTLTIARYTLRGLGEPVLLLLGVGFASLVGSLRFWRSSRLVFLLLWAAPAWLVYFLIWPGNIGTILVTLPPLFLLAAAGLERIFSAPRLGFALGWVILGGILLWNVLVFTVMPVDPWQGRYRTFENYASLRATAAYYQEKLALIDDLPVQGTLVVAGDFRHLQYYLPEYQSFSQPAFYKNDPLTLRLVVVLQDGRMTARRDIPAADWLPQEARRIVFFSYPSGLELGAGLELQEKQGERHSIYIVEANPDQSFYWSGNGLVRVSR